MYELKNPVNELSGLFSFYEEDNILFLAMIRTLSNEKLDDHVNNLGKVKNFIIGLAKSDELSRELYEGFIEDLVLEQMVRNAFEGGGNNVRIIGYQNTSLGTIG